ncbi:MAG: aromatic amino acid lyase [Spiribacter salinus]|uniref:Aromatic amino acid lyase n=1 Tax=Spiribacter salinus TaxID=1335746 RepID=A0A540VPT8_9GAMM|nr:MAG: aromatic amino acid lyase [Spiribacter salinus]
MTEPTAPSAAGPSPCARGYPDAASNPTPNGSGVRPPAPKTFAPDALAVDATQDVRIGPDTYLRCEQVEALAHTERPDLRLSETGREVLRKSHATLGDLMAAGAPIYGITTGFGPLVRYPSAGDGGSSHGAGLIAHLGAGCGPLAPAPVVRATMIARAQAVAQGYSGLCPDVLVQYLHVLRRGLVPAVPTIGSVGASGDLIPLAHIARVLTGEGQILEDGVARPAAPALRAAGLSVTDLSGRDALALVNGTSFMTAYAALALARAQRLVSRAEALTAWIYQALSATSQALAPRLHQARGHAGQRASAAAIRRTLDTLGGPPAQGRHLQEIYSIRCAPQILGACRDQMDYARRMVETELNGVNDNPVFCPASEEGPACALHGGNFQGQQIAFAADALNAALTQTALLAERQLDALLTPSVNGGAPLLLAWTPGATSGLAGAQITATALAAEMRTATQAYGVSSIPTNGGNQDIVSMGTLAARRAYEQTDRLAHVLATLGLALAQLHALRTAGRADGPEPPPPPWMPAFEPIVHDRPLRAEVEQLATAWMAPGPRP